MKILILGSEGFIGSHLVKYFTNKGYEVFGCDLKEIPGSHYTYFQVRKANFLWSELFSKNTFNYCVNAAGNGNVSYSLSEPVDDFDANTFVTMKLLDDLRRHNPNCRYLHLSSAAVYGNPLSLPVKETDSCMPVSPYGWHKLMAEQVCKEHYSLYNLPVAIVRPFSIYGEGLKKQLFWDIFQKYQSNAASIELWGTGKESRDFIYIDDVMRAIDFILQHGNMKAEIYNLASGVEVTIKEVVALLFRELDPRLQFTFNNRIRQGDPLNWRADVSELKSLGFEATTTLEAGIKKLSHWLLNQE